MSPRDENHRSPRDGAIARLTAPGARFEIVTEPVRGHATTVFRNRHRSLGEILEASKDFGDVEYLVTENERITFADHYERVAALATALRDDHGVGAGDRVALCAANCPEWITTFWATVALGAVAVGMNSMWAGPEVEHGVTLTAPKVVLVDADRRPLVDAAGVPDSAILDVADLSAIVDARRGAPMPSTPVDEDDPVVVLFTSGTTGRPKGATHSHRNMIAAVWFHLFNDALAAELGAPQKDRRFLLATPLFHIAALHNLTVIRAAVGDTAVIHQGRFDIDRVLRLIETERVTNWGAVPTMLNRVVNADVAKYDLTSLRTVSVSSAPSSPELKEKLRQALPVAAASLGTTYGLTESSTAATLATAAELVANPGTVGRAIPTMQVRVCDEVGTPVADGVEGEIHLHGPQVMLGYWDPAVPGPVADSSTFTDDGWLRTGDLGTLRDGELTISSRRSDLILRGGENVYPAEVEDQLTTHPLVEECIVVGLPDPDLGQIVAARVVVSPGGGIDEEGLAEYASGRLARYKVPTRWIMTSDPLPRNATGKVNRKQIHWS